MNIRVETWMGHKIRFVEKENEWWAVLKDITDVLELRTDKVKERLTTYHISKGVVLDGLGKRQEMLLVNEMGIYETVFESRKKEAKKFKEWLYSMLKQLREASGLEGFQVFKMLDKEQQKSLSKDLHENMQTPKKEHQIKANTIANKAVSNKYGYSKSLKKYEMTEIMLKDRQVIFDDAVKLMIAKDRFNLDVSVSETIYKKHGLNLAH